MAYKTQNPHLGPSGNVESFAETSWPNDRVQLGYLFEKGGKRYQCAKVVDATAAQYNLLYWKNYASYEATPTIGNSSRNELAGVVKTAIGAANTYAWLQQGGLSIVTAGAGTFARGTIAISDTGSNRVIPKILEGDAGAGVGSVFTPAGLAMAATAAAVFGLAPAAGHVVVLLDIAPLA